MFTKTSLRATLIAAAALATAASASAQELTYTPSKIANVNDHPFFPLSEINDGISDDIPPDYNGFITRTGNPTLGFDFGGKVNVTGMKLWDDVNVRAEGVASFTARFYDAADSVVLTYTAAGPDIGQVEESDYVFVAEDVVRAEIDFVAKDLFGIEIRELTFFGSEPGAFVPIDYACTDLLDHEKAAYRKEIRFEDGLGQAPKTVVGQPVSLCLPSNVQDRTIDVKPVKNFLVCYEAAEIESNRRLEGRFPIINNLEDNVIVTGGLGTICMASTPNR